MYSRFLIHQATGSRLGMFCQSIASIGTGVIIGFIYSWELTLCVLAFAPFIMVGGMIEMKILAGQTQENAKALEHAGKVTQSLPWLWQDMQLDIWVQ